jgi:signal transduction histidine kinase
MGRITSTRRPGWHLARLGSAGAVAVAVVTLLFTVGAGLLATRTGVHNSLYTLLPFTAACGLLGGLLAALRPRNPVGWGFTVTGLLFAVGQFAEQYAAYGLITLRGSLPAGETALWLQTWIYKPALIAMFVLVPVYFPNGRLPSVRWRWLPWAAFALGAVDVTLAAVAPTRVRLGDTTFANPVGVNELHPLGWLTNWGLGLVWLSLGVLAVGSLVLRFRRAGTEQRQQIKWLVYSFVLVAVGFVVDASVALAAPDLYPAVFPVIQLLPLTVVVAAVIAILRHRLFDIDLLIHRTLVYGALTICLVVGYVLVVGWLGTVFPARGNGAVALIAAGVVAVAFAPLRDWLQRLVNRLLYGDRDDPYRVLTRLSRRLDATIAPEAVLPTIVDTVSTALKLPYTAVEVGRAGAFVVAAERGQRPANGEGLLYLRLAHGGEEVGRLALAPRGPGEEFSTADRQVLGDLAHQIGAAVHAVRLSADLQRSREQLVVAREEERRRVGRDLHDGLGPQLAALTMKVEAARDLIPTHPNRAVQLLSELLDQTQIAVEDLRRVAHKLRPPVLDALGLPEALRVHAGDQRLVRVQVDLPQDLPPLPAAVEVAAYHIALEALHNVANHAGSSRCTLRVQQMAGAIHIEIGDDGPGIPADHRVGVGLSSMRERAAELGGSCTIESADGGGTLIRAVLPLGSPALVRPG